MKPSSPSALRSGRAGALLLPVLILAAAAFFPGCPSKPEGDVIARVGKDYLTKEQLDALVPEGSVDRTNLPQVLDKWVSNTLMYQEALRRGLDKDPEVVEYLDRLRRDYLVNTLLERITTAVSVGQNELVEYFDKHRDEFSYEVKILRIVLQDSVLAERTRQEIADGADFSRLAAERSQDVLLEAGQESRYFARGVGDPRMGGDPDVEDAIFALAAGEVSGVIASQEGYQIVKLVDRKKVKDEVSLAEVRDYIEAVIGYRKSQALVDSTLAALREGAAIELTPDAYFQ